MVLIIKTIVIALNYFIIAIYNLFSSTLVGSTLVMFHTFLDNDFGELEGEVPKDGC